MGIFDGEGDSGARFVRDLPLGVSEKPTRLTVGVRRGSPEEALGSDGRSLPKSSFFCGSGR